MNAAWASNASLNVMTSAPLEQQKQWCPRQQEGISSKSHPASMCAEAAYVRGSEGPQNPNAAVSAANHNTSSRTLARLRREVDIRSHCNMAEWVRQSEVSVWPRDRGKPRMACGTADRNLDCKQNASAIEGGLRHASGLLNLQVWLRAGKLATKSVSSSGWAAPCGCCARSAPIPRFSVLASVA